MPAKSSRPHPSASKNSTRHNAAHDLPYDHSFLDLQNTTPKNFQGLVSRPGIVGDTAGDVMK